MRLVRYIVFALFVLAVCESSAQKGINEISLEAAQKAEFSEEQFAPRKVTYLFSGKSGIVKYNPVSLVMGGALLFYQKVISQQLGSNCPYEISCSEFSRKVIHRYGIFKGVALSADRLMRCTQFTQVDVKQTWFNENGRIKDPIERYARDHHRHQH